MAKNYNIITDGKYKLGSHKFNLSTFSEFVEKFNVFNNDLANQENLNKGADQLKRELNLVYALFAMLTDSEAPRWQPNVVYVEGEIVSFLNVENPTIDQIRDSYYIAKHSPDENLAQRPDLVTNKWLKITAEEVFPRLNSKVWAKYHNDIEWTQDHDLDLINLKKLMKEINNLRVEIKNLLNADYLTNNYTKQLTITAPTHVTNKEYVDAGFQKVANSLQDTNSLLGSYVRVDNARKLIAANNGTAAVLTPDGGIHPGINNVSTLGTTKSIYKAVYATDFVGTALRAKYADLAETYDFNIGAKPGDIIGINLDGFKFFDMNCKLIGVVSDKPAIVLNETSKGTTIALKGQTPVKVKGQVRLGDYINAYTDGYGIAGSNKTAFTVGIALEESEDDGIKLINTKI